MNLTGIRYRLLLLGILPSFSLVISVPFYFIQYHYLDLEHAHKAKGQITIEQLAISSISGVLSGNSAVLANISNALLEEPDIASVQIFDISNQMLAQSARMPFSAETNLLYFEHDIVMRPDTLSSNFLGIPYIQSNYEPGEKIGTVKISLSMERTHKRQQSYLVKSLLFIAVGISCTIALAIHLSKSISSPILALTKKANDLADGKMDTRAEGSSISEIDDLCQSFNTMAIGLQQTQLYLIHQVELAVKELTSTLSNLEEKNKILKKNTQLAIHQNKTKSQFISHISHEIRTPMNGVLGFIDLLTKSQLSIQQLEQVHLIKTSATSLLTIVNEILDYSSLETGDFKINISKFKFRENIENCATTVFPVSKQVQIILDIENNIPTFVPTDPIRLQQIITNLIGNACRFTSEGHIIIRCRLLNNNSLYISISDTGTGVPEDQVKDLFQPNIQSSDYTVNNEFGTGLGLTICRNIVTRLGGTLGVSTKYGIGSTFWLTLPVTFNETAPAAKQQASILVIDPFKLRRNAFVKQFKYIGYEVKSYSSVTKFGNHPNPGYDLIFYAEDNDSNENIETGKTKKILNQLRSVANQAPVIFVNSNKKYFPASNCLPFPCRSSYLNDLIITLTKTTESLAKPVNTKTAIRSSAFSIFIADDNEINRLLLKSQLEVYCKNITLAKDGKTALVYLQQNKYDLIMLDLQMPHLSGLDLIKLVKQENCINKDSPIIAITAHAQSHQRKTLIDAGFDECLIKPVLLEQLFEILDLWLPENHKDYSTHVDGEMNYAMIMLEKTSGNIELAISLFNKLFSELKEQPQHIEKALEEKNYALAEEITHKLHGSVSFCGFHDLQEAAKALEIDLMKKNLSQLNTSFVHLKNKTVEFIVLKEKILNFLHEQI